MYTPEDAYHIVMVRMRPKIAMRNQPTISFRGLVEEGMDIWTLCMYKHNASVPKMASNVTRLLCCVFRSADLCTYTQCPRTRSNHQLCVAERVGYTKSRKHLFVSFYMSNLLTADWVTLFEEYDKVVNVQLLVQGAVSPLAHTRAIAYHICICFLTHA